MLLLRNTEIVLNEFTDIRYVQRKMTAKDTKKFQWQINKKI